MAMQENNTRHGFPALLTNLATNTTLGTATRHDFAAGTILCAENSSRTFLSVELVISWRDAFTVATNVTGWRMGIKLGAVAFDDVDITNAQANTGDHESGVIRRDVTSYFNTNFGAGTSQTCQVGIAISTAAASNVNNITAHLVMTYEFDDVGATTRTKTVPILIQSHHTFLSTAQQEVGTTGGAVNAPANQIPALDTYLAESSKTYSAMSYVEVWAQDWSGGFTTDITPFYQIDAVAEMQRATLEQALGASTTFRDIFLWDTTTHSPAAVHAFKARADVDQRMVDLGAVMWVTFTYTASSTTITNVAIVPLEPEGNSQAALYLNGNGTAGDANAFRAAIDVQEPGTITTLQSGVMGFISIGTTTTTQIAAGGQAERTYNQPSNAPYIGPFPFVHRADHSTGWALVRGRNNLTVKLRQSVEARGHFQGYAIVVWRSSTPAAGVSAATKTTSWFIAEPNSTAATTRDQASGNVRTPKINPTHYALQGVLYEAFLRVSLGFPALGLHAKVQSGEWTALGWFVASAMPTITAELTTHYFAFAGTSWFNALSSKTGRANIETARAFRFETTLAAVFQAAQHVAYHGITYAISGTVSNTAGAGGSLTVDIFRTDTDELVNSATTAVGGAWTSVVFDDTVAHYAVVREDATHKGRSNDITAPAATYNIDLAAPGGGGGDTVTGSRFNRGFN